MKKVIIVCLLAAAIYFGSWLILTAASVIEKNTGLMLWTGTFFVAAQESPPCTSAKNPDFILISSYKSGSPFLESRF